MNFITLCAPVNFIPAPPYSLLMKIAVLILLSLIEYVFIKCLITLISNDSSKEKKFAASVCIAASAVSAILLMTNVIGCNYMIDSHYYRNYFCGAYFVIPRIPSLQVPASIMFGIASYSLFQEKRKTMPVVIPAAAAAVFSVVYRFFYAVPFFYSDEPGFLPEIIIIIVTANICLLINVLRKKLKFT